MIQLEVLNTWFSKWEPIWLFVILAYEAAVGTLTLVVLLIEYWYDKAFNDNIKAARRERRRKKYEFEHLTEGESK
jgi:hypothetical protein